MPCPPYSSSAAASRRSRVLMTCSYYGLMQLYCNTMQVSCTVGFVTELLDSSVDWTAIESWLAANGVADGQVTDIEPIGGGTQNLMFKFGCGDPQLVLRRGPLHLRPHTNNALRREARVLGALTETAVPIPRL